MRRDLLLSSAMVAGGLVSPQVLAQDAGTSDRWLDQVVVTAQKREENAQDVPITISAVSPERLDAAGVRSTQDLQFAVPGTQFLSIGGQLTPRVRGVGGGTTAVGTEAAIATYIDDIYIGAGPELSLDFADVQQISVLKGPQGTLFGRNATGGVVQIQTRSPEQEFSAELRTSLDNYRTSRSSAFVTGGLSENLAGSLFVGYTTQGEGWGVNLQTGNDSFKIDHAFNARGKLLWDAGENTTILFNVDYLNNQGNTALNFRPFPGGDSVVPVPQSDRPWDFSNFRDSYNDTEAFSVSLKVNHDLGFAELVSISAYRDSTFKFGFSPGLSNLTIFSADLVDKSAQFTQEFQLISNNDGPFQYTAGAFYYYAKAESDPFVAVLSPPIIPFSTLIATTFAEQETHSIAGFVQGTYEITPTTRITGGIRLTYDTRDAVRTGNTSIPDLGLSNVPDPDFADSVSGTDPTWRVSIDQSIGNIATVYASYNRGLKSGGFNLRSTEDGSFEPEQLDAFEVGFKSDFLNNSARVNFAAFYYDYKNFQATIYRETSFIRNGGGAEAYGADLDIQYQATDNFLFYASISYLETEFTDFDEAPTTAAIPNPPFAPYPGPAFSVDAAGNDIQYSSKWSYLIGFDYIVPTPVGDVTISVTDSYNSGFFPEPDNILEQPGYHLLNSSVTFDVKGDSSFILRIFGTNLLNEAVVNQAASLPGIAYIADYSNPPRIFGGEIELSF